MFNLAESLVNDKFQGGRNVVYGLKEGGVGIAPTSGKLVPQDIFAEVKILEDKIISGEIIPPTNKKEWEALR